MNENKTRIDAAVPGSELPGSEPSQTTSVALLPPDAVQRIKVSVEKSDSQFSELQSSLEWQLQELFEAAVATSRDSSTGDASDAGSEHGSGGGGTPAVFGVTSAIPGEGKTTVAIHLALTLARNTYQKVCLLDLSMGDDDIRRRIGAPDQNGVIDILEGDSFTLRTVQLEDCGDLTIIPAGRLPMNPNRTARSPSVPEVIAAARQMYDIIIVDLPAVATGNALPLAVHLDRVLMVVRAGVTPKEMVTDALERIGRHRTLGVVLNRITPSTPGWARRFFARRAAASVAAVSAAVGSGEK